MNSLNSNMYVFSNTFIDLLIECKFSSVIHKITSAFQTAHQSLRKFCATAHLTHMKCLSEDIQILEGISNSIVHRKGRKTSSEVRKLEDFEKLVLCIKAHVDIFEEKMIKKEEWWIIHENYFKLKSIADHLRQYKSKDNQERRDRNELKLLEEKYEDFRKRTYKEMDDCLDRVKEYEDEMNLMKEKHDKIVKELEKKLQEKSW